MCCFHYFLRLVEQLNRTELYSFVGLQTQSGNESKFPWSFFLNSFSVLNCLSQHWQLTGEAWAVLLWNLILSLFKKVLLHWGSLQMKSLWWDARWLLNSFLLLKSVSPQNSHGIVRSILSLQLTTKYFWQNSNFIIPISLPNLKSTE